MKAAHTQYHNIEGIGMYVMSDTGRDAFSLSLVALFAPLL